MKGSKENGKSQKHSQASEEGSVPSSQDSHPSSSPLKEYWEKSCCPYCRGDLFLKKGLLWCESSGFYLRCMSEEEEKGWLI